MNDESNGRVLVVDDDPQVRELFAAFLDEEFTVETAASGEEALATITDDIDVVLLDRMMPGLSGDEVLTRLRERGFDCRVAMVTAVAPGLDVVELGFDDYLIKPVTRSQLHNVVDSLLHWGTFDDVLVRYFAAARQVALLERELPRDDLEASEEYQGLLETLDTLRVEADEAIDSLDSFDVDGLPSL